MTMNHTTVQTNWCIITGAPSSGKTTLINALSQKGLDTEPEIARSYFKNLHKIYPNYSPKFQKTSRTQNEIFDLKYDRESKTPADSLVFFDRGLPDSLAYFRKAGIDPQDIIPKMYHFRYANVFFLEGLPVVKDDIRQENQEEAELIGELIYQAYIELGYTVNIIPPDTVENRLNDLLKKTSANSLQG